MGIAIDRLGSWLLDAGVAAAAWLSLVMMAMVACRQPIFRRDLARVGIVGALLIAPLSLQPTGRLGLVGPLSRGFGPIVETAGRPIVVEGLGRVLTLAYLGVGAAGIGWVALGGWAMRRLIRSSAVASHRVTALYDGLPFDDRAGCRPRLRVSGRIGRPALVGVLCPTIVIPEDWDRPGSDAADRLRLGMVHELAHAERSDPVFHWLGRVSQAVWFAIPMMWWIRRQLGVDQEVLADERTARRLGEEGASYASRLVGMAGGTSDRGDAVGRSAGGDIATDGSPLVRRVAMLVRCPFPIESIAPLWWRLGLPPAALAMMLAVSRLTVTDGPPAPEPMRSVAPESVFHLHELSIAPSSSPSPMRLPAPLPRRFELSMMLRVDPAQIGEIAVAGVRLGGPIEGGRDADAGHEVWQRIRLVVDGTETRLWVDDRPATAAIDPMATVAWLTVRPAPGRAMEVRDLILTPMRAIGTTASRAAPEGEPATR